MERNEDVDALVLGKRLHAKVHLGAENCTDIRFEDWESR